MKTIYLKNFQLETVLSTIVSIVSKEDNHSINGLTALRLNKIRKDLFKEYEDFNEQKKKLMDEHVKGGSEDPKEKDGKLVFKTKKGEDEFFDFINAYSPIHLRCLLDELDFKELKVNLIQVEVLEQITSGLAITKNPEEKEEEKEEEEEKPKAKKTKAKKEDK